MPGVLPPMMHPTTSLEAAVSNNTLGVGYSAAGFLVFYMMGVSKVLQQLGIIKQGHVRTAGSSIGALVQVRSTSSTVCTPHSHPPPLHTHPHSQTLACTCQGMHGACARVCMCMHACMHSACISTHAQHTLNTNTHRRAHKHACTLATPTHFDLHTHQTLLSTAGRPQPLISYHTLSRLPAWPHRALDTWGRASMRCTHAHACAYKIERDTHTHSYKHTDAHACIHTRIHSRMHNTHCTHAHNHNRLQTHMCLQQHPMPCVNT